MHRTVGKLTQREKRLNAALFGGRRGGKRKRPKGGDPKKVWRIVPRGRRSRRAREKYITLP